MLVLHYTGMASAALALERLCDPAAQVSAHYLIDEDGAAYALVAEGRRAWHAGLSYWAGERDINSRSIGIELQNPGHGPDYHAFPPEQMRALIELARGILARHAIPPERVLGHSDVAPSRKQDPGELFDWQGLAAAGIGRWPPALRKPQPVGLGPAGGEGETRELQHQLARFGYAIGANGRYDAATRAAVAAFQRHFRPVAVNGLADGETRGLLAALLDR
ncbi:MAG: N-acetylmuramoyl-L-alanine amidase [Alphaproteobacteria bacterium]|nr:N-acetylmuramoyl-L-alanine amidase [Alphaproteobacteria bacterium]